MDKLAEATKLAKQVDRGGVDEAIQFAHDVVGGKLKAAEKENEFVYHEKVPEKTTLPEIKGASLVKGTPFDITDPEVSGQDIFHRLVPMEAHEASSLYSEEKAKLLRRIGAMHAHAKAAESNMLLHKAINSHLANLRTLSLVNSVYR